MYSFFEKLVEPFPAEEPVQPPDTLTGFCIHFCKGAWPYLIAMSLLSAAIAIVEVSLYGFMGSIVDWLAEAERETFMQEKLPTLIWMGVLLLVVFPILAVFSTLLVHQTLLGNLPMIIRWQAHRYVLRQSQDFFNYEFAGRIGTKVMQTSLAVRETVMKLLDILVYVAVYFFSLVFLVATADWRLMLPLILWFAFYVGVLRYFVPRLRDIAKNQADTRALMTGRVIDSYTNISTVKLFSHAGREAAYAREGMEGFMATVYDQMRRSSSFQLCVDISSMVLLALIMALAIFLWLQNAITPGAIAIAAAVVIRLHGMSHWVMWEVSALFENIGIVQDGIQTLSRQRSVQDAPDAQELARPTGAIEYRNVSFDYGKSPAMREQLEEQDRARLTVINDFDLHIQPGEKVGLVGRSGAGKTTLVNLLLRLYDLPSGSISIDGIDIKSVTQDSLRANIGVVTQDTSLLHRSVFDNIAYGSTDATMENVLEAAEQASARAFIDGLVDGSGRTGFDAHVGERGVTLSGGQRQRIALARVFLKDAPILVLDEATSALDSEVEAAIQENLSVLMQGKTVVAIAHRLSTIAEMDRLVVMDEGRIIETGSHRELNSAGGLYASLWQRQSGGFIAHDA